MKDSPQKIDFAIGGQALIEGVMMRSPSYVTMAVRKKDGSIKSKEDPFKSLVHRVKLLKFPLIRGVVNLIETMALGMRAINFSAQEYAEEEGENAGAQKKTGRLFEMLSFAFSIMLSLALAIFLFKFIPLWIAETLRSKFPFIANHYVVFNAIDGIIRIGIFFLYILTLSFFKSFRRIFEYHGAEHMAIHAYEKGRPLKVREVRRENPEHPRCGTSFLIAVLIISIAIYSFIPRHPEFWINLSIRISVLPLIASLGYEVLKWSAKRINHPLVKMLVIPGLLTQKITTKRPEDGQIEIAIHALSRAIELESGGLGLVGPKPERKRERGMPSDPELAEGEAALQGENRRFSHNLERGVNGGKSALQINVDAGAH